jgi:O-antigen/teichoic acid export membrane protein
MFVSLTSQFILLLISSVQYIVLPKYLDLGDYGYWQLFILYGSYIGILQFGFVDGILIKWAGKNLSEIDQEYNLAFGFLIVEQVLVISLLAILVNLIHGFENRWLANIFIIYAFVINLTSFFTFSSQALKKFKLLSCINILSGITLLIFIAISYLNNILNYKSLIYATMGTALFILLIYIIHFRKNIFIEHFQFAKIWKYGLTHICVGFFVLIGNYISIIILNADR